MFFHIPSLATIPNGSKWIRLPLKPRNSLAKRMSFSSATVHVAPSALTRIRTKFQAIAELNWPKTHRFELSGARMDRIPSPHPMSQSRPLHGRNLPNVQLKLLVTDILIYFVCTTKPCSAKLQMQQSQLKYQAGCLAFCQEELIQAPPWCDSPLTNHTRHSKWTFLF